MAVEHAKPKGGLGAAALLKLVVDESFYRFLHLDSITVAAAAIPHRSNQTYGRSAGAIAGTVGGTSSGMKVTKS